MRMIPIGRVKWWGCLAAGLLWTVMGPAPAEGGDFYVGLTGSGERLGVLYDKTVDNTAPNNISLNPGEVFRADDSATKAAFGYGFLAGYRVPLGLTGIFVAGEGDMAYHRGAVIGRLPGLGTSEGRNQLGEVWPEDWSFDKDRSIGFTLRLGAGIPVVGPGLGPEHLRVGRPAPPQGGVQVGLYRMPESGALYRGRRVHLGDRPIRREFHRLDHRRRDRKKAGSHRHKGRSEVHRLPKRLKDHSVHRRGGDGPPVSGSQRSQRPSGAAPLFLSRGRLLGNKTKRDIHEGT